MSVEQKPKPEPIIPVNPTQALKQFLGLQNPQEQAGTTQKPAPETVAPLPEAPQTPQPTVASEPQPATLEKVFPVSSPQDRTTGASNIQQKLSAGMQ